MCVQYISLLKHMYVNSVSMIAVLSTEENIAFGRPTRASSVHTFGLPSNAVDGDSNGIYSDHSCTQTVDSGTAYPWWAVDLGSARHIDTVHIYNRVDCQCDFLHCNRIRGVFSQQSLCFGDPFLIRKHI